MSITLTRALFIQMCEKKDLKLFETFLKNIFDVFDCVGWAAAFGHLEIVKILVSRGANVRAHNDYIVRWAAENGQLDVVKYLVSQGADIKTDNNNAIRWAARGGYVELVKYLVSQGADIHSNDDCSIRWASIFGHLEVVKYLVSQGADIQACANHPIHLSSKNNHYEVVIYLLEKGVPSVGLSQRTLNYISFCKKMEEKRKIRAQKIIYYWWIPICYDMKRECGKRMAQRNYEKFVLIK